jgi:hypothetical protein
VGQVTYGDVVMNRSTKGAFEPVDVVREVGQTASGAPVDRLQGEATVFAAGRPLKRVDYDIFVTGQGDDTLTLVLGDRAFDFVMVQKATSEIRGTSELYPTQSHLSESAKRAIHDRDDRD